MYESDGLDRPHFSYGKGEVFYFEKL